MKKISICIPCYNEEANIKTMSETLESILSDNFNQYKYEIIFSDNDSTDKSREILKQLTAKNKNIKAIFNTRNFGPIASNRNSILSATGDAVITINCDFQDPPELIIKFISLWEKGNYLVCGQKNETSEKGIKKFARSIYYRIIQKFSGIEQENQVTGFSLMDRDVVEAIRAYDDPNIALRHVLADIGYPVCLLAYKQKERRAGKSSYNFIRYFDFALTSLINTSYLPLRLGVIIGLFSSFISLVFAIIYLIYKLMYWDSFSLGTAPILIGLFLIGSIQLLFMGLIGEYIVSVIKKVSKHPSVYELCRLNFEEERDEKQ